MLVSILNRTILWDLLRVFMLSLIAITSILMLAVVVVEARNQGLDPVQILAIVPLAIPSTLPYTIPTTTLFATCVVYGRLAHDNEILALRAAGIHPFHVIWPAMLLGTIMSVVTGVLYYELIPKTYHMMKSVFLSDIEHVLYARLKQHGQFSHPRLNYEIHVARVQGKKLFDTVFMRRDSSGGYDTARAGEAVIQVNLEQKKILIHMRRCYITNRDGYRAYFIDYTFPIDLPADLFEDRKHKRTDMTWTQLLERKEELCVLKDKIDAEIALQINTLTLSHPPERLEEHISNLRNVKREYEIQYNDVVAELHRRPALSFGCLCFVLIGCPVGIWFSKSDYLSAFVTCFLPIVMVYYPLVLCGENLARTGSLNVIAAMWAADGVLTVVALVLYWLLSRH